MLRRDPSILAADGYHPLMPLLSGSTFAQFKIVKLLGAGAMGQVYLAEHPRLPKRTALKLLPWEWSADQDYRARFTREADLASTLWHPHIVGVHDRGEAGGQLWISMDYVDGLDAARLLTDRYPAGMPVEYVIRIVTAVASGLDYAHKQGLLHRDVKPANIMLTHLDSDSEQRILLTDFGIARSIHDISGLTQTNMTVGTVAYCAPEQLLGEDIDGRADQYALAAAAYHMLAGTPLFSSSNPAVVISRHLNTEAPALADIRPDLAGFDPVFAAALAKQPENRFNRCSDFALALSEQMSPTGRSATAAPTTPAPVRRSSLTSDAPPSGNPVAKPRGRTWVVVTAATLAIAVIAATVWAVSKQSHLDTSSPAMAPSSTPIAEPPPTAMTTTSPPPPPPPPQTLSPDAIDRVLLTADRLSNVLGVDVTNEPSGGVAGILAMNSSSYGTSDHSRQVTPRSCVGIAFTGEHDVFSPAGPPDMKTETFGSLYQTSSKGPYQLSQTAAVFRSAEAALDFMNSSQAQWGACGDSEVQVNLGFENGRGFTTGPAQRDGDLLTISMASPPGLNSADACQQAMGVKLNVVTEARICETPDSITPGNGADPDWAKPYAGHVVEAMLDNVIP